MCTLKWSHDQPIHHLTSLGIKFCLSPFQLRWHIGDDEGVGKGAAYPLHKITFAVIACLHTTHKPLHPCAPSPLHMIPRIAAWPAPRGPILHSHISSLAFHNSHAATNIGPRGDAFSPLAPVSYLNVRASHAEIFSVVLGGTQWLGLSVRHGTGCAITARWWSVNDPALPKEVAL